MGKIIALVNQKGGVGKTTTSINLSASLGALGKRVLLVDLDPQGNSTTGVGIDRGDIEYSVYDLLIGEARIQDVIIKTRFRNLYVIPTTINLAGVALDCPPSLGVLTTNALAAAHSVIIPVQCEFFALEGIMQLLNSIMIAQKKINPTLDIEGVLLTMLDNRTNLGLEVVGEVKSYFKERVYDTIIPRLVRLSEAPSHGKPIIAYDPKSRGAEAYINLAKEVILRNGK